MDDTFCVFCGEDISFTALSPCTFVNDVRLKKGSEVTEISIDRVPSQRRVFAAQRVAAIAVHYAIDGGVKSR